MYSTNEQQNSDKCNEEIAKLYSKKWKLEANLENLQGEILFWKILSVLFAAMAVGMLGVIVFG